MLKGYFKKVSRNAAEKEIHQFLTWLRSGTNSEMSTMLCATGIARQFLTTTESLSRSFPEAVLSGRTSIDPELSAELSMYILEINKLRKQLMSTGNEIHQVLSSGLGVYVQSIRALQHPELFALGRAFWTELQRGTDGFSAAMRKLKPEVSGEDLERLLPIPNMLAPELYKASSST